MFGEAFKGFASQSIEVAQNLETIKAVISAVSGSSVDAANNIKILSNQSKELQLNRQATLQGASTFLSATQETNLEGNSSREILTNFNVIAKSRNLSKEAQERALTALAQMASKGTIQSEELKGQLAEALPGSYQTFARSLGMSSKQFSRELKAGNIQSSDLIKFSQQAYAENITSVPLSLDTYTSSINKLDNAVIDLQESFGNILMPFNQFVNNISATGLTLVTDNINSIIKAIQFLAVVLTQPIWLPIIQGIINFITTLNLSKVATINFSGTIKFLATTLTNLAVKFLIFRSEEHTSEL